MQLKDYIPKVNKKFSDIFFSNIAFDSFKVKKDSIFFAIKGNKFDGNDYIDLAIKKGAKIIVSEKKFFKEKKNVIFLHSSNVRKLLAEVSYKVLKKKTKKNNCSYGYKWKIINSRFLLSNTRFKF